MGQKIILSIAPGQFPQTFNVSQNDVNRELTVQIVDVDGNPYLVPNTATVKLQGTKPSTLGFSVTGTVNPNNKSVVTFETTNEMTDEYGRIPAEVRITDTDDTVLGSANLILDVEKNPHPNGTTDGSAPELIPIITQLVERAETAAEDAEDAAEDAQDILDQFNTVTASATTLPAGSDATVTYNEGAFAFGIPKGDKGDKGNTGNTGPTGPTPQLSIGSVITGEAGTDAAVTITGTDEEPVLNFTIPRGDPGKVTEDCIYAAKWDRTTNKLTRLYDAASIPTDITNFCHKGSINPNYDNPFDMLYPWRDITVCNVDLTAYRALQAGASLSSCITAIYGDPDFTYFGSENLFVGVYIPDFWYWSGEDSNGAITYCVSETEKLGYKHHEEEIRAISFAVDVGNSKVSSGAGLPLTGIQVQQIHSRANSSGFTLTDIESDDAIITLFLVEFADMNGQNAIGSGCDDCYRQNAADVIANVDNTGDYTVFEVTDSALGSYMYKGVRLDFGTSVGATTYGAIVKDFTLSGSTYTVTLDRKLSSLANDMYLSVHGFASCEFPYIGQSLGNMSGYLGTNGKANAYYRGMVLWANIYRYTLGIYRQQTTNHLWICPQGVDPDDYDALNTSYHQDTGVALPSLGSAGWQTVGANAQRIPGLYGFLATDTSNGSSSSPVGDQQYVPLASAGNTILLSGGYAYSEWYCGLFCGSWDVGASYSWWNGGGSPLLKRPQ